MSWLSNALRVKKVNPDEYRMYMTMNYVFIIGMLSHVLILIFYLWASIVPMVLYNIISVSAFFAAFIINRHGHHYSSFYIGGAEIFIHAVLSIYYLGWSSGFHYYILIVAAALFLVRARNIMKIVFAVLSFALYCVLYLYASRHAPAVRLNDAVLLAASLVNIMITFFTLAMLAMYYQKAADSAEKDLRIERNKLKKRNQTMEMELDLARRIQKNLIPEKSPEGKISYFYRPMSKVGGDFFDFVQLRDPERTGVFISDVSGHGVPAALLTSMIKSLILQSEQELEDPALFLHKLNELMFHMSGGNFITAFYGIIEHRTCSLKYASAGHNPPIVVEHDRVYRLVPEQAAPPLLAFSNTELLALGKGFNNQENQLQPRSKLVLYTDGLTETVPAWEREDLCMPCPDFESEKLDALLLSNAANTAQDTVNSLIQGLESYRGSSEFEDDVCIICLEL